MDERSEYVAGTILCGVCRCAPAHSVI